MALPPRKVPADVWHSITWSEEKSDPFPETIVYFMGCDFPVDAEVIFENPRGVPECGTQGHVKIDGVVHKFVKVPTPVPLPELDDCRRFTFDTYIKHQRARICYHQGGGVCDNLVESSVYDHLCDEHIMPIYRIYNEPMTLMKSWKK